MESVKAVLDIRNEELKRLRVELELMRRDVRDVRDVRHRETQTRDDCDDVRLQGLRGRSNTPVFIYV